MPGNAIDTLRQALALSPDNIPLRCHLAEMLLDAGAADEAIGEFRAALGRRPNDSGIKLSLARAYFRLGQDSPSYVIVEELIQQTEPLPEARLLYARLLRRSGEVERAVVQYKQAVEWSPQLADRTLEEQLGIGADPLNDRDVVAGRIRAGGRRESMDGVVEPEQPRLKFADVGGMEDVKEQIRIKIVQPFLHPEIYRAYGKRAGGGILMYGPPGCGKTLLARATAGEVNGAFYSVGLHDVLEMWIGQSERNLHLVFEQAREQSPCVLFFDEVDALGASRNDMRYSAGRQTINQFLAELDGSTSSNDDLLILAASNAPWHIDAAFRRPGRFDRVVFVPPPDEPARAAILRVLLRGKPCEDIDYDYLAGKTAQFSGADLKAVVDRTVEDKLQLAFKAAKPVALRTADFKPALKSVKPSTIEWLATARNYALYSNEGGAYDEIRDYLKLK